MSMACLRANQLCGSNPPAHRRYELAVSSLTPTAIAWRSVASLSFRAWSSPPSGVCFKLV